MQIISELIQSISLIELTQKYWTEAHLSIDFHQINIIESTRQREYFLRKYLPSFFVRRLDTGFARSNTVHPDTGYALYLISRLSQSNNIFETGTYWGYSTTYLAAALRDNQSTGKVYSFDLNACAGQYIPKSLQSWIILYLGKPSVEVMPEVLEIAIPDLFFQDSRHDYDGVVQELRVLYPHFRQETIALFHDFIEPEVQRAVLECLPDYSIYVLESGDPQKLGVAIHSKVCSEA